MLGIQLLTWWKGEKVGEDEFGNIYYRERGSKESKKERRWVIYSGTPEPSKVPAYWHGWLHHAEDTPTPVSDRMRWPWQKTHLPNLTGTLYRYLPRSLKGAPRPDATGDYTPWKP